MCGAGETNQGLCHRRGDRAARQAGCPAAWQRQNSHGGGAWLQDELATKRDSAEETRIVAEIPQGAGAQTSRVENGASCHPAVRLQLLVLNTENTKNPRIFTEKSDIALRAKRLKFTGWRQRADRLAVTGNLRGTPCALDVLRVESGGKYAPVPSHFDSPGWKRGAAARHGGDGSIHYLGWR